MPEICEIINMAQILNQYIAGSKLIKISEIGESKQILPLKTLYIPKNILGVTVRGKKLIFMLEKETYIVCNLSLSGHFSFKQSNISRIRFDITQNNSETFLYFDDQRKFASFEVYTSTLTLQNSFVGRVGPDYLTEKIQFVDWMKIVKLKAVQKLPVCSFLNEQKYFSGIGNIYRSEIAYYALIDPKRTMSSLSAQEYEYLFNTIIKLLQKAYKEGGYIGYTNPLGGKGRYETVVYKKQKDPYGQNVIIEECKDKRKIFVVPSVQK